MRWGRSRGSTWQVDEWDGRGWRLVEEMPEPVGPSAVTAQVGLFRERYDGARPGVVSRLAELEVQTRSALVSVAFGGGGSSAGVAEAGAGGIDGTRCSTFLGGEERYDGGLNLYRQRMAAVPCRSGRHFRVVYLYPGISGILSCMGRIASPAAEVIGANIARYREARAWTKDQLAVATSIDSSNIRSYESGRATMNLRSLLRIAEALDVSPGDLLEKVTADMFASSPPAQ